MFITAHTNYNIKAFQLFKGKIKISLFFHNPNYDIKFFINTNRNVKGDDYIESIGGVPCKMEIFKSLNSNNNINIIDSLAHLRSLLSKLIKNLPDDKKKCFTDDP